MAMGLKVQHSLSGASGKMSPQVNTIVLHTKYTHFLLAGNGDE